MKYCIVAAKEMDLKAVDIIPIPHSIEMLTYHSLKLFLLLVHHHFIATGNHSLSSSLAPAAAVLFARSVPVNSSTIVLNCT